MRRDIKIERILPEDNQITLVQKLNLNFDSIIRSGGGPLGSRGSTGETGPIGLQGEQGPDGNPGIRGNRWFVSDSEPSGSFSSDVISKGDYWINTSGEVDLIYYLGPTGWIKTPYNLASNSEFTVLDNITGTTGITMGNAVVYRSNPGTATLNFSDTVLDPDSANPLNSMLSISSDPQKAGSYSLLEFSRGDLADGSSQDYLKHPIFTFSNGDYTNSSLSIISPNRSVNVLTDSKSSIDHSIRLISGGNISISSGSNVVIRSKQNSANGVFISASNFSASSPGNLLADYYNLTTQTSNRIIIKNRINLTSNISTLPALKVVSRATSFTNSTTGISAIRATLIGSPDQNNYLIRISSSDGDVFKINGRGKVYLKKESLAHDSFSSGTNNISQIGTDYVRWYMFGNTSQNLGGFNRAFGAKNNEIILNPTGIPSSQLLGVGLFFDDPGSDPSGNDLSTSYLNNLISDGESLRIRIRSINKSFPIKAIAITSKSSSTPSTTQNYVLDTPSPFVDFTLFKNGGNEYVYYNAGGASNFWDIST